MEHTRRKKTYFIFKFFLTNLFPLIILVALNEVNYSESSVIFNILFFIIFLKVKYLLIGFQLLYKDFYFMNHEFTKKFNLTNEKTDTFTFNVGLLTEEYVENTFEVEIFAKLK